MMNLILSSEEKFLLVLSACLPNLRDSRYCSEQKNTGPYGRRIPYFESYLRSPFGFKTLKYLRSPRAVGLKTPPVRERIHVTAHEISASSLHEVHKRRRRDLHASECMSTCAMDFKL